MANLFEFNQPYDLSGHTLIIPSVSVGNVPQLTVDLLITTYNLKKVATVWHPAIISSVGGDPYASDSSEICTAFELFTNSDAKLAAIQFRSSLEYKLVKKFIKDLKLALDSFNLERITVLSSGFDYELHIVSSDKFYYLSNEDVKVAMQNNNIKPIEENLNGKYNIHGDSISVLLYDALSKDLKTTVLVKYVSEGDNIPDAVLMLEMLCKILNLKFSQKELVMPVSWKYVFGGPPPAGMF